MVKAPPNPNKMNLGRIADATCNADERIATQQAMPRTAKAGIHKFLITNSRQMSSLVEVSPQAQQQGTKKYGQTGNARP
jgi:hypothetical protein